MNLNAMLFQRHAKLFLAFLLMLLLFALPACAEKQIRLTFTGDVTLGSEEALRDEDFSLIHFAEEKGYDYFFSEVRSLFEQDDLTIVNLEGVLSDSSEGENTKKTYRFRGPTDFANILSQSSIEMANLANNHSKDYGERGYEDTQAALDRAGVQHFGGHNVCFFEKDGIRLAFVGMSYTEENRSERQWLEDEIKRLKQEANAVIFCYHGGREYSDARTEKQMDIAKLAIHAGADLVIMHHPHVVQGMSIFDNRTACYSLGNFCFGGNKRVRAKESLIVAATLTFSDDGTYLGQQLDLYPAHISGTTPQNNYQPHLVTGSDARLVMKRVRADTRYKIKNYDESLGFARQEYLPAE